ncbi:MAG: HD domain-containing protein [Spirochaetes bacterium]|nr:HD domain-containing protein [Spirochaetota bacterium]
MNVYADYCSKILIENGFWSFYAFETARDLLLRKKPSGLKVLTNADISQLARLFGDLCYRQGRSEHARFALGETCVSFYVSDMLPEGKRAVSNHRELKKKALCKAAEHTPLLSDGFFYDVEGDLFYDPYDAYPLLKRRMIRTRYSPEKTIKIFPLLALKAAKAVSETGFELDDTLGEYLGRKTHLVPYRNAGPAVVQNFIDILHSTHAYRAFMLLDKWGILDEFLPELSALKSVHQDKDHHPEGNAFLHTIRCLSCVKKPDKNLMMAILLHDTGKAVTKDNGKGSMPFPEHSAASALIAKQVLRRFGFTHEDTEEVLFCVKHHMIVGAFDRLPEKRVRTLFMSPFFPNLLELFRADITSGYHDTGSYYRLTRRYREFLRKESCYRNGMYAVPR